MSRQHATIAEKLTAAQKRIVQLEMELATYQRTAFSGWQNPAHFEDTAVGRQEVFAGGVVEASLNRICPALETECTAGVCGKPDQSVFQQLLAALQINVCLHDVPSLALVYKSTVYDNDQLYQLWDSVTDAERLANGLHPGDLGRFQGLLDGCREGRQGCIEYRLVGPAGEVLWYETRVCPIRNDSGMVCHVVSQTREITYQKKNELSLGEQRKRAEGANQAKSDFLANMSHEIRTPLNGILGMLDLLGSTSLTKRQQKYLELATTSGGNLLDLINDILDFSKIEAGKLEAHEEDFLLPETLEAVLATFALQAEEKRISLDCRIEPIVPSALFGDGAKLRQILLNLLGNAVKFTLSGSVVLEVCRLPDPVSDEVRLLFIITDTGVGIADDKVGLVFEEFSQVGDSHTRMYAGTGLGLGIVKRLVTMLGGTISLESRAGEGTSIYFTVKMKSAGREVLRSSQPLYVRSETCRPLTVLLAEDDRINRLIGGSLLENMGHKVVFAENGIEVMQIMEIRQDIDCILMDIQMPEMDGIETSRAIRQSQLHMSSTSIPIIALTAHALHGDRERFMAVGMDEYLTKPYKADELRSVLERVQALAE